ncbi:MAG: hypothetical protein KGL38_05900, partial [Gemmatimonadota bacterium]|nr:hypothetical protein [Gemmatimonadota bacterium]
RAEGDRLLDQARGDLRELEAQLAQLERSRRTFVAQFRTMVERQLAELTASERLDAGDDPGAAAAAADHG